MPAFGIDFGTTNSVVARHHGGTTEVVRLESPDSVWTSLGFDRVMPTVVALDNSRQPVFGWQAKRLPRHLAAVKRLLQSEDTVTLDDELFSVEEIAALLFSRIRQSTLDAGLDMRSAVVTVPANSKGLPRWRTKIAAGLAGIEVPLLLNEPTAAAMAYGLSAQGDQTIMVVDWGGGTLDVTILEATGGVFIEQSSKGIGRLGGLDFDNRLIEKIRSAAPDSGTWSDTQNAELRLDVELAKIRLSHIDETTVTLPGQSAHRISRKLLEEAVRPHVERVREPIMQCLADLRATPADIDALVLVGGTCKIPLVRDLVMDIVGVEARGGVDPMTAIAEGAALAAAVISGERPENDFLVSTEHALGTIALDAGLELRFSEIIPRNHKLPARRTETYHPTRDGQESVIVQVVEGDPSLPLEHPDNVILANWEVSIPDPGPVSESSLDLTYEYDRDGILHVGMTKEGKSILQEDVGSFGPRSKSELVKIAENVQTATAGGPLTAATVSPGSPDSEIARLVATVRTKVLPFVGEDAASKLQSLIDTLISDELNLEAADALRAELQRYTYLL